MRVMLMHKTNPSDEAGIRPPPVFRDGAGLRASSLGVRLQFRNGAGTIIPGPFTGQHELPAALCVLRVRSRDDAIEWASRFGAIVGDAERDLRPVTEPWDLGVVEPPKHEHPMRYMAVYKADANYEAGALPAAESRAAVTRLIDEMKQAGVYLAAEALQPSSRSRRIRASKGKHGDVELDIRPLIEPDQLR